jgi:hypothetical protein
MTTDTRVHHNQHPSPDGDRAVEVVGMLAESVVDVKHLEAHARKPTKRPAYLMMAAGALMLLVGAGAFAKGVSNAAANQSAKDHWVNVEMKAAQDFRPERLGLGWDALAFGGLGGGLLAFAFGFARLRSRVAPSSYTVGRNTDADFAIDDAPVEAFELVAQRGTDMVVTVPATMNATLRRDGARYDLEALAGLGMAQPSATVHGARELIVPADGAAISIDNGLTRFHIRSVPKQRSIIGTALARFDRKAAKFFGLSAIAHLAVVMLLGAIPPSATTLTGEAGDDLTRMTLVTNKAHEAPVAETQPNTGATSGTSDEDAVSAAANGDEGKAGDPTANESDRGALAIKDREDFKHKSRDEVVAEARDAGFLGVFKHNASMLDSFEDYSLPSGYDQFDNPGNINGDGNDRGFGNKGLGFRDNGPGGGNPDGDTIKTGDYNTIPRDDGKKGTKYRPLHDGETTKRENVVPDPIIGHPVANGELDKSIIRRYIRAQMERFRHAFEVALLSNPNLQGTVTMQFFISPQGKVLQASVSGVGNATFRNAIKSVLNSVKFPAPTDGGTVHVTAYDLTFRGPASK